MSKIDTTEQTQREIVLNVAQEAVDDAFRGRFITGSKDPTTERHVTRAQLFEIVLKAVLAGRQKAGS